jgi:hypothetical protein
VGELGVGSKNMRIVILLLVTICIAIGIFSCKKEKSISSTYGWFIQQDADRTVIEQMKMYKLLSTGTSLEDIQVRLILYSQIQCYEIKKHDLVRLHNPYIYPATSQDANVQAFLKEHLEEHKASVKHFYEESMAKP